MRTNNAVDRAHARATRFEALEPIRQGVRRYFGGFADAELDQVSGGQGRPGDSRPQLLLPGAAVQFPPGAQLVLLLPTGAILEVTNDL